MEQSLTKFAEYGLTGVAVAAIFAAVIITKFLLEARKLSEENAQKREDTLCTIVGNHIDHATVAQNELSVAIKELSTIIREKIQ